MTIINKNITFSAIAIALLLSASNSQLSAQTGRQKQNNHNNEQSADNQSEHVKQKEQTANVSYKGSDRTDYIISEFSKKLSGLPAFEMGFSININGQNQVGTVQGQKDSYRLDNKDMSLYCDGNNKWIHNPNNNEVVVMKNDLSQVDLIENPMAFFTSLDKGYTYSQRAKSSNYNKIPVWVIDLMPINKRLGYSKISLLISKRDNAPVRIVYVMKSGESHAVNITKFVEQKPWGQEHFKFDVGKHKGIRVNDMR